MFDRFKRRSYELEYLDTGDYTAAEYEGCIGELQLVNRWMGDTHSLKSTLLREIEHEDLRRFSVLDVGAGSGELLRVAAAWARETGRDMRGVGLELNERSVTCTIQTVLIEFINLMIDHLTERGSVDPRRLYESPFTDLDDQGVSGLFPQADVQRIVRALEDVRKRAAA